MADNQMYWPEQPGWYQQGPPPPPSAYQPAPYQMANNPSASEHSSPPAPRAPHQMYNQPQPMMPNGAPPHINNSMQSSHPSAQHPPTSQVGAPNHYNQHEQQMLGHPPNPSHMQPVEPPAPAYQMQPQAYHASQQHPPSSLQMYSQTSTSPNGANYPPPNNQSSVQQGGPAAGPPPPPPHHQQHQHQQAPMYQPQQYSSSGYWNQGAPPHPPPPQHQQQMATGPPPPPPSQALQPVPSSRVQDGYGYSSTNEHHLQPPPSQPSYDARRANMQPNSYNSSYPQPTYYNHNDHRQAPPSAMPRAESYEQQAPWSNGYHHTSHSPFTNEPSHYGSGPPPPPAPHHNPNHQGYSGQHPMHGQPPPVGQQGEHRTHHQPMPPHQHQQMMHSHPQQQHWSQPPPQNHCMPMMEPKTKGVLEKKPVKPRGPRKAANPDAPRGRRKAPMSEEHKQSAYAKFFQIKQKEITKETDFGDVSKIIAEQWAKVPDEEKAKYAKDVSKKRKEMLKKKASQQAQELLVRGMTHEHDVLE